MTRHGKKGTPEEVSKAPAPSESAAAPAKLPTFRGEVANLRRNALEANAVLSEHRLDPSMFPEVKIPDLSGIVIEVPEPPPIEEEEVQEAFERLAFEAAIRHPKGPGKAVEMGDEVIVDLVGYMGGYLLPMTAHEGMRLILEPNVFMPTFGEQLLGTPVGQAKIVEVALPDDFAIEEARGMGAVFAVEVREASKVIPPDPADATLFQRMGLGETLEKSLESVLVLLLDQRARKMAQDGMRILMETLLTRTSFDLPPELIEAEVQNWWRRTEGRFLADKGLSQEDLETSLGGWMADDSLRLDAIFRLKSALLLFAIAKQERLVEDRKELKGFIGEAAQTLGISLDAREKSLARDFKEREVLIDQFVYAKALAYINDHVTIHYEGTPAPEAPPASA
ncbi:MAG: hypothetical protein H6728_16035 [Myxococcales bacterium]|nr:hypothetical protein [Myxococcales bacterium]MCB9644584.1 hypothetical protein [Myxococcales bacterium]